MPRPKIDVFWRDRVRELTEQNPRLSSRKITGQLEVEAGQLGRSDWPSEKTVRNIIAEHRAAPAAERKFYQEVYWPESFGTAELPWEAAPAVLEAMRLYEEGRRPTLRAAAWFWRVTLVAPAMEPADRLAWALVLAASESAGFPGPNESRRDIESLMLHPGTEPRAGFKLFAGFNAGIERGWLNPALAQAALGAFLELDERVSRRVSRMGGKE